MNLAFWLFAGILGYALLFAVFWLSGLSGPSPREPPSRWLLFVGVIGMAVGLVLVVFGATSVR